MEEKRDLGDVVLSWSVQEILDDRLRQKVEKIPCEFTSLDHYFKSYVAPLIEETRAELRSSLELVMEAPYLEILSMEVVGDSAGLLYKLDVDAGYTTETYMAKIGDIFILSSLKPEAVEELSCYGGAYCVAMVTDVSMDVHHGKELRIKVLADISAEDKNKLRYALFAANIITNIRIWNALCSTESMNDNFTIIKSLLSPKHMGYGNSCSICVAQYGECLSYLVKKLELACLNQSQQDVVISVISALNCKHSNLVKLIWGPPGTGKTKTISAILWTLKHLNCRTLTCAPTNIAVVRVCSQLLQGLKGFNEDADTDGLPCPLGNILLFGNRYEMDITEDLQEVLLDYRADELVECFSSSSGWRYRIDSVISLLQDYSSQQHMLHKDNKQFGVVAKDLKKCMVNLRIHLPERCLPPKIVSKISNLLGLLETIGNLLFCEDLTNDDAKRGFGLLSIGNSGSTKPISFVKEWDEARSRCLELLKYLKGSLDLPVGVSKAWTKNYCMRNATLIFCTVSSSYHLHHSETSFEVLIVDETAQLRECESVIPLRLHGLRHVILVGDDCQLQPIVRNHVCREAGFGVSLFKRLVLLGFEKHLLNMQYRMNPCISLFPNARFYKGRIINGQNVKSPSYNNDYLVLPFGCYTFLNITDGKEEMEGGGNSWRNMVEVALVLHLIQAIFKSRKNTCQKISIGVVSPYSSQVNAIKSRLGMKYDKFHGFDVRVMSIDGFQGEEDDLIILSTVRSNSKGTIGFLSDIHRTNVALTRARHCLWILGNANTLSRSGSIWEEIVSDAKQRECLLNATDDAALCKLVLQVKTELDQLGDLLNSDSAAFCNTRWKIIFSSDFRNAFMKVKSVQLRREVLQKLVGLGCGWRGRVKNLCTTDKFDLAKVYKVNDLYLVWSTDLEKAGRLIQILRIWDLVTSQHIERSIQRLENLFSLYTDDYVEHCKRIHKEGKWEVPMVWRVGHDVTHFKKDCRVNAQEDHDHVDASYVMDQSKVSESFLLMKFYCLSSGVAKHLLTATDGSKIDIPFELTEEEEEIIRIPHSSFILGRSGTGKTTVLSMKLIQREQQSLIANQGLNFDKVDFSGADGNHLMTPKDERAEGSFVKQIFLTVSPKLCSAVKKQISRLKRFAADDFSGQPSIIYMHDISDDLEVFHNVPDSFNDLPQQHYPLTITFWKFLMMLDGTLHTSFFDRYGELRTCTKGGKSKSHALQAFIETKEVHYEKFSSSYWPHFSEKLTKNLDASTVFTQIISHIKGGYKVSKSPGGNLERKDYIMLSDGRSSFLSTEMRDRIYGIFLLYEKKKCIGGEFDISDFVNNLHRRLSTDGYSGDMVDFIYIDEVQDLTISQIALLKYVCSNFKEGFIFAGDTAQTIARGIDFRFEDIRSCFYTEFLSKVKHGKELHASGMFQLSQNFRTHCGILMLAQSIMDLMYYFFPSSVDELNPETSLVHGEAPVLLESCNGENAFITIFKENKSEHDKRNMFRFGADQVILVRDDSTKEQIVGLIGKRAIVLTILESKGLEFEDVLLYNFFCASPLRKKWRVVYEYMKGKDIVSSSKEISHPEFSTSKHALLCSELKQLYVAVTRTKQRLWVCDDANDFCQPIFDYWKKLCLIQVRQLDSSIVEEMQLASRADEWRLRGIKLFNEKQFGMASMCFEKAGDEYREKWAIANELLANGERLVSRNWERSQAALNKAAEIYCSIGKHEKVATCYIKSREFRKAGLVYLEKCGDSRLEDAGDCFSIAECWSQAADAYFEAKHYAKCISTCLKGKLFDKGLQFLQQMKEEGSFDGPNSSEMNAIGNKYLEDCALYYFRRNLIKHMMRFVKAFSSMDTIRAFLISRTLFNELLSFEVEMGNFVEAAEVAEHIGSILLRMGTPSKTASYGIVTELIILNVIMNILWNSHVKGWSPKILVGKEQLLKKAREIVEMVSNQYCYASLEADALSDPRISIANLSMNLLAGSKHSNMLMEFFAARSILDIHLLFRSCGYSFELHPGMEDVRCDHDMLTRNRMSPESLIRIWKRWKSFVVEALSVKVLSRTASRESLQAGNSKRLLNAIPYHSSNQNYWTNELYAAGMKVLSKMESFVGIFSKEAVRPYAQGLIVLAIYEITKFLKESKFSRPKNDDKSTDFFVVGERLPKSTDKWRNFFALSERFFFELVFLDWKDETTCSLLYLLSFPAAIDLLVDSLNANVTVMKQKLNCEQLVRVTVLLLLSAQLDDRMISSLMQYAGQNSEWTRFLQALKTFLDRGNVGTPLLVKLRWVLESNSITNCRLELDCTSPMCYDHLMKWFGFLASSYTKSLLVEMLKSWDDEGFLDASLVSCRDLYLNNATPAAGCPVDILLKTLLSKSSGLQQWVQNTSASSYVPILLRLVIALYLGITLQLGDPYEVSLFLSTNGVLDVLPWEFSENFLHSMYMRSRTIGDFMLVFADALAAMGNHLAVMGLPEGYLICLDLITCIVSSLELSDLEKVREFFHGKPNNAEHESSPQAEMKCESSHEIFCVAFENFPVVCEAKDRTFCTGEIDFSENNISFWEKFDKYLVSKQSQEDAKVTIHFLNSALSWLEQRGPEENVDVQFIEEVRSICDQFKELLVRYHSDGRLTTKDLYSKCQDGEKKLLTIISFLCSMRESIRKCHQRRFVAAVVDVPVSTDARGCASQIGDGRSNLDLLNSKEAKQ